jgi:hypothetical protein
MHNFTKTILALAIPAFAVAQNGPIDFEMGGEGANWTWTVFENVDNPPLEIITNPDQSGFNTSQTVAKFTARQAGQPFAGVESLHGAGTGSFIIDASNSTIRIMVWKSKISDVGIKLVEPDGRSLGEIKVANTVVNQWEQLTFDFTNHIGQELVGWDQVVVFPDFDLSGRTQDEVIYFDNIFGPAVTIGLEDSKLNKAKIFPNPGTNNFSLESATSIQEVKVYNVAGNLVLSQAVNSLTTDINTSNLSQGIYIIHVAKEEGVEVLRWVKQN